MKPNAGRRRTRSKAGQGTRWGRPLASAAILLSLLSGCKDESCGSDGNDCGSIPPEWVAYDIFAHDPRQSFSLRIEPNGRYVAHWRRELTPDEEAACDASGADCTADPGQCWIGRLDNDQIASVEAVQQSDLMDAYTLDDVELESEGLDRAVAFQDGAFNFVSEGPLQSETAALIDTLDALSLELYGRGEYEYCNDDYRRAAESGDWVFPTAE
jgi:hypothetical protein